MCRLLAVLSGLLLYPKETAPPDVGGGDLLEDYGSRWAETYGASVNFSAGQERRGQRTERGRKALHRKGTQGNESIKKASRSASEWLKKSMKGKTNCEKRSGTLLLNFDYAKLDIFLSIRTALIPSFLFLFITFIIPHLWRSVKKFACTFLHRQ